MKEKEMEDLLWRYPDRFFNEPLTPFQRQPTSEVGRADLVFKDRLGRLLVVELKKGKLERGAIDQLMDYFGMLKRQFPDTPVELMVIANNIPEERQLACDKHDISCFVISEKKYRDIAAAVGYQIESETSRGETLSPTTNTTLSTAPTRRHSAFKIEKAWDYSAQGDGKGLFLAFVNAKGNCSVRTFDQEGFFLGREYGSGDYQSAFDERYKQSRCLPFRTNPTWNKLAAKRCRTGF